MPKYSGSCGCYNREAALELGLPAAILLNWLEDKHTHYSKKGELVDGMFWADQTSVADELAFEIKMLYRAIEKLEERGILVKRVGYRPNSTIKTTWWGLLEYASDKKSMGVSESTKMGVSIESTKMGVSILNDTKKPDLLSDEGVEDTIPLAQGDVQAWLYDTDENGKTIAVEHTIHRRDWNKAVRKWREDEGASVLVTLKDTGATERMTFKRVKKFNVRPSKEPKYKEGGGFVYAK